MASLYLKADTSCAEGRVFMHRKKHKHHSNPLEKIGKQIMATLNELLAAITTIAKGNGTDQATKDAVAALQAQMVANNDKLVANDADDAESKQINADQQVLIEALINQLAVSSPSSVPSPSPEPDPVV